MSVPGGPEYTEEQRGGPPQQHGSYFGAASGAPSPAATPASGGEGRVGWADRLTGPDDDQGGKPFFLTSEFLVLVATIVAVVIAAAVADDLGADRAWTLVTVLSAAYILSRGLSKIGQDRDDDRLS